MAHEHACHGHDHKHGFLSAIRGHSHEYDVETEQDRQRLVNCMLANGAYGLLQLVVGFFLLGSMILVTDAFHNITDMFSLGIPLVVILLQGRQRRISLSLTWTNYLLLYVFLVGAVYESALRVFKPESAVGMLAVSVNLPVVGAVNTGIVMACLAGVGIGVNAYSVFVLRRRTEKEQDEDEQSLNMRSAFQHQLVDLVASITAVIGSAMIAVTGERMIDPVLTIAVSMALAWMVWPNFMQAWRGVLESLFGDKKGGYTH